MEIETFEVEETCGLQAAVDPDAEAQALQLIEELGLGGQHSLVARRENGKDERNPFPKFSAGEKAVYETLFPTHVGISEYKEGMIPCRVLEIAKRALPHFEELQVWHAESQNPDPVLVGVKKNGYSREFFLIARWGAALQPYAALLKEAKAQLKATYKAKAEALVAKGEVALKSLDSLVEKTLRGQWIDL